MGELLGAPDLGAPFVSRLHQQSLVFQELQSSQRVTSCSRGCTSLVEVSPVGHSNYQNLQLAAQHHGCVSSLQPCKPGAESGVAEFP